MSIILVVYLNITVNCVARHRQVRRGAGTLGIENDFQFQNGSETAVTEHELLQRSRQELEAQINRHWQLVEAVMDRRPLPLLCLGSPCRHRHVLLRTLFETVQVLEESRKAFKSRQLEKLRKRLLQILADEAGSEPPLAPTQAKSGLGAPVNSAP
jgi:hypothetical protein